jgi:cytochrome c peroxidase
MRKHDGAAVLLALFSLLVVAAGCAKSSAASSGTGDNTGLPAADGGTAGDATPPQTPPSPSAPVLPALPPPSRGFSGSPVPQPRGGSIVDSDAAIRLGKALFWDAQAGSDGQMACASCHFAAGADARVVNTINPGPDGAFYGTGVTGPGQTFTRKKFLGDDRVGSSGVLKGTFVDLSPDPADPADICDYGSPDPLFGEFRQVTGRQAPPVIGAVFNRDNFWDGRASHLFNGNDPLGATTGLAPFVENFVENAGLASQAVGPALSSVEMSCADRKFNGPHSLGAKLLARTPLAHQLVAPDDSVLGPLSNAPGNGLKCGTRACTYQDLIAGAFGLDAALDAENRFSSLWGQAIQAYEATLVPDHTPYDRFIAGDTGALSEQVRSGLDVFRRKGCANCHVEPELTDATVRFAAANPSLLNADRGDLGFHNIGVSSTADDLGRYSFSVSGSDMDRGAFKTPALRNVALTAPYFHNGSAPTIAAVVDFYENGGIGNAEKSALIQSIAFTRFEKDDLAAFLAIGLTDCRVQYSAAPFDHPSLDIPDFDANLIPEFPNRLPAVGTRGVAPALCP